MKHAFIFGVLLVKIVKGMIDDHISDTEERPHDFNIAISPDYDRSMAPKENGNPASVRTRICPWKIGEISVSRMTIEIDVYVKVYWADFRVTVTPNMSVTTDVILKNEEIESIWMPVVTFRNAMGDEPLTHKPGIGGLRWSEGRFFTLVRKTDKFHCDFKLHYYPMDTQECLIEVQALNYKSSLQLISVPCESDGLMSGSAPPEFKFVDFYHGNCSRDDKLAAFFSCVQYGFRLQRQSAFHMTLTYLPSMLIVILSFISFWLEPSSAAPRVALSLTSLLTLTTQFSSVQKDLPPVAYVKAIDIWMFACIFIVFGGLIEFAFANFCDRRTVKPEATSVKPEPPPKSSSKTQLRSGPLAAIQVAAASPVKLPKPKQQNLIDRIARRIFPLTFLIFNIAYWGFYGSQ